MRTRERMTVAALAAILGITAAWWALALWPVSAAAPAWIIRTRAVCFGSATGLPDASGWMLLVGEPALMLGMLFTVWGGEVRAGLRALGRAWIGRLALRGAAIVAITAAGAAVARVATAAAARRAASGPEATGIVPADYPRLDRPAAPFDLVDQDGRRLTLGRFRGRPLLVTFAFAHCETVCPLVVREVLHARTLAGDAVAVVVTLDPWRDPPARLPAIAAQWGLAGDAFLASGDTTSVAATLDRWNVARERDLKSGAITHVTLVYIVDRAGRIAYAVSGATSAAALADLVRGL